MVARVRKIPFRDGQSFKKGEAIVEFECDKYVADLKASQAEFRGHKVTHDSQSKLLRHHAAGAMDVELAKAQKDKASAAVEGMQAKVDQCRILAPFNGRVADVLIHEHDTPAPNAPLIKIVDDTALEIDFIVPSKWLAWLKVEESFTFQVDETGTVAKGRIVRVGAAVDPVSQTIKVTGVMPGGTGKILPGMSGTATFAPAGG